MLVVEALSHHAAISCMRVVEIAATPSQTSVGQTTDQNEEGAAGDSLSRQRPTDQDMLNHYGFVKSWIVVLILVRRVEEGTNSA